MNGSVCGKNRTGDPDSALMNPHEFCYAFYKRDKKCTSDLIIIRSLKTPKVRICTKTPTTQFLEFRRFIGSIWSSCFSTIYSPRIAKNKNKTQNSIDFLATLNISDIFNVQRPSTSDAISYHLIQNDKHVEE